MHIFIQTNRMCQRRNYDQTDNYTIRMKTIIVTFCTEFERKKEKRSKLIKFRIQIFILK